MYHASFHMTHCELLCYNNIKKQTEVKAMVGTNIKFHSKYFFIRGTLEQKVLLTYMEIMLIHDINKMTQSCFYTKVLQCTASFYQVSLLRILSAWIGCEQIVPHISRPLYWNQSGVEMWRVVSGKYYTIPTKEITFRNINFLFAKSFQHLFLSCLNLREFCVSGKCSSRESGVFTGLLSGVKYITEYCSLFMMLTRFSLCLLAYR